jgi:hypothetical protein
MAEIKFGESGVKSVTLVGPLFASATAISYDVGFFFGTDIGFFTFFSLTEHLVFALQAIPFAGPAAFMILSTFIGVWYSYVKTPEEVAAFVEKYNLMPDEEKASTLAKLNRSVARNKKWNPYIQFGSLLFALWNLALHNYTVSFLMVVSQIVIAIAYPTEKLKSKNVLYLLAIICGSATLFAAFLVGIERADNILKSVTPTERISIDGNEISSRLVRAGDRGLLYFSIDTKKLNFVRWDTVKKIETF